MLETRLKESELENLIYNRLTLTGVTYLKQSGKQKRRVVQAICKCGKTRYYDYDLIKRGETKSCGCLKIDVAREMSTTHGLSTHTLYKVWIRLKEKCNSPKSKAYRNYGGKGVKLCEEWEKDYVTFYNWAILSGWKEGLQIDKDKLFAERHGTKTGFMYSPEYCCFLSQRENKRYTNRTVYLEFNGQKMTISEWARELGVNRGVISNRLRCNNGDVEKTLSTPIIKRGNK
jgi:hypothetical protein